MHRVLQNVYNKTHSEEPLKLGLDKETELNTANVKLRCYFDQLLLRDPGEMSGMRKGMSARANQYFPRLRNKKKPLSLKICE